MLGGVLGGLPLKRSQLSTLVGHSTNRRNVSTPPKSHIDPPVLSTIETRAERLILHPTNTHITRVKIDVLQRAPTRSSVVCQSVVSRERGVLRDDGRCDRRACAEMRCAAPPPTKSARRRARGRGAAGPRARSRLQGARARMRPSRSAHAHPLATNQWLTPCGMPSSSVTHVHWHAKAHWPSSGCSLVRILSTLGMKLRKNM